MPNLTKYEKDMAWALELTYKVYKLIFTCEACGNCCKHITSAKDKKALPVKKGTSICRNFDESKNSCVVYLNRPACCKRFPVYGGDWRYNHTTVKCPVYIRYVAFAARRHRANEPWGYWLYRKSDKIIVQVNL